MLFSREGEYTIQTLAFLALKPEKLLVSNKELTARLGIPHFYLGKILQKLARKGILHSRKGPSGGFRLAVPAENITLYDILETIDGTDIITKCSLGFNRCNDLNPCGLHNEWRIVREGMVAMLRSRNILAVAKETHRVEFLDALRMSNKEDA